MLGYPHFKATITCAILKSITYVQYLNMCFYFYESMNSEYFLEQICEDLRLYISGSEALFIIHSSG